MMMQIILFICSQLVYSIVYSSMDNSTTQKATFEDLCKFDGKCLNCSEDGCDDMCEFYNNECCLNTNSDKITLEKWQFSCIRIFPDMYDLHLDCHGSYDGVYGVYMVAKCSNLWTDELIKSKCENNTDDDLLSKIPVYDNVQSIVTYKNMYCAFCNWLQFERLSFWRFDMLCNYGAASNLSIFDIEFDAELCFIRLIDRQHKMCALNVIDSCPNDTNRTILSLRNKCESGLSQNVYVWRYEREFSVYKNEYCAQCNGEISQLQCWAFQAFTCWPLSLPPYTGIKTMISLTLYGEHNRYTKQILHKDCGEGVLFSPFSQTCLNITCLLILNTCVSGKCHLVRLFNSEFEIGNFSDLYLFAIEDSFHEDRYFIRHQNVYVCLDDYQFLEFEFSRQTTTQKDTKSTEERSIVVSKGNRKCKFYFGTIPSMSLIFLFVISYKYEE